VKERKEVLYGQTQKVKTGCGSLYITINKDEDGKPIEIFMRLGKAGGCASSQSEALGRLLTMLLRLGASIPQIVKQLRGIGCHQPIFVSDGIKNLSCADGVAQTLDKIFGGPIVDTVKKSVEELEKNPPPKLDFDKLYRQVDELKVSWADLGICPDCGTSLRMEEGCAKCTCGFTRC